MIIKEDKWSAFGHYTVGTDPTPIYNLTLALEAQVNNPKPVRFHFHDELYSSMSPQQEPSGTLLDLYSARVKQLREKYDYLILFYSGGADSHNILKCFEHADVKLDEVVSFVDSEYAGKDSIISSEIYKVAIPEVQQYQEHNKECVYTLLEIREIQKKIFSDKSLKFDLYQDFSYHFVPFSVMHLYALNYVDRIHKLHEQGKRVGVIQGIDKVKIVNNQGKWNLYFSDFSSQFGHKHYYRDLPFYDEFFYWTPDMPQIAIKQAHVVSRYLDYLDSIGAETHYRDDQMANVVVRKSGKKTNWDYINHIVYPFWKSDTFSMGKTNSSQIVNPRDNTIAKFDDELLKGYKKSMMKKALLAKSVDRHLTPKLLSDSNDDKTVIGIRTFITVSIPIE